MRTTDKKQNYRGVLVQTCTVVDVINTDVEDNFVTSVMSPQTGKLVNITTDGDVAMNYATVEKEVEMDDATNKRTLRKIDMCLMPVMCLLYCFQFIDKMANSYASIMGMRED